MNLRVVLAVLGAAATLFVGAWMQASFELTERVRQVALGANGVCGGGRGMEAGPPTVQDIADRFSVLATENSLEASDVHVRMEPLRAGQGGLMGGVMAQLGSMSNGGLTMSGTQVTVDGVVRGKKWLWKTERAIQGTCALQGKVERVLPSRSFGEE